MKHIATAIFAILLAASGHDGGPIKFLGTPVDGPEKEFAAQLKSKGFKYVPSDGTYAGQFKGTAVRIRTGAYRGRIHSVGVFFPACDAESAKLRYNALLFDLIRNPELENTCTEGFIPDNADMAYGDTDHTETFCYFDHARDSADLDSDLIARTGFFLHQSGLLSNEQKEEFVRLASGSRPEQHSPYAAFWEAISKGDATPKIRESFSECGEDRRLFQKKIQPLFYSALIQAMISAADGRIEVNLHRILSQYFVSIIFRNTHNLPNLSATHE